MVCAGGARNKGMCFGDSGGPLVWYTGGRYRLQGIVSWTLGRTCATYRRPGVYVDVRRFNTWIRSITGGRSWLPVGMLIHQVGPKGTHLTVVVVVLMEIE